jgi:hypothetical protein
VTIDLNSTRTLSDRVVYLLDRIERDEEPRKHLGASVVGHPCERNVQYHLLSAMGEIDAPTFPARIRRIFDRGHRYEAVCREWFREIGIEIAEGPQFRGNGGIFAGSTDGLVVSAPSHLGIATPCLWECKTLGAKGFKSISGKGVREHSVTYYAQIQVYMAATGQTANPALYTAVNADTMDVHCELVHYDGVTAIRMQERVTRLVQVTGMGELVPRHSTDSSHFVCKMCPFSGRCW